MEDKNRTRIAIIIALIGLFGVLGAAFIENLSEIIELFSSTNDELESLNVGLEDSFDSSEGSYNTNLWDCANECSIESLSVQNGVLMLQRKQTGWTSLSSRKTWLYEDLASLEGKLEIGDTPNSGHGWLAINTDSAACDINGEQNTPFIQCHYGPWYERKYSSSEIPIKPHTWYQIKIEFDWKSQLIRYYVDGILIGQFTPTDYPDDIYISLGVSSENDSSRSVLFDDVKLVVRK